MSESERAGPMLNPPHLGELIRESMEEAGWSVTETSAISAVSAVRFRAC